MRCSACRYGIFAKTDINQIPISRTVALRTFSSFLPLFTHLIARLSHEKSLFCLPDKRGFLQLYPFLPERVIYLRYDIALRAMIYAFGIWRNGYYIMLAAGKYIIRQRRISYCASDISLKSAAKRDIICSINQNLTETGYA